MHGQLEDIIFTLSAVGAVEPEGDWGLTEVQRTLGTFEEFIGKSVDPTRIAGDREGCRIEDGRVRMPAGMPLVYRQYVDLGWQLLPISPGAGGFGAPAAVAAGATELLAGGSHAFQMLVSLVPAAVRVIEELGTEAQKAAYLPPLASGQSLATMCITESGAGSDLGAIQLRATENGGAWHLDGEKIFISGGDQNLSETIVHLVLARTGAENSGTKGLSLFVCPSRHADGVRNSIDLVRIEEKLGLHASPTCHLRFDGAWADLIGAPGEGLAAMFIMMNHARLNVALQGIAHAAQATLLASEYASARAQGGRMISEHGDVRRMLDQMRVLTLGGRAMAYRAASLLDEVELAAFLTPACKVFCTDAATEVADLGIQVLGGYGYLPEYGMEQIWREARVTRIYEGTNGVLSMALAKRLLRSPGEAFLREVDNAARLAVSPASAEALGRVRAAWVAAHSAVAVLADPGRVATALMRLAGLLFFASAWVRLEAASGRMVPLARFVRTNLLPEAEILRLRCEAAGAAD